MTSTELLVPVLYLYLLAFNYELMTSTELLVPVLYLYLLAFTR